MPVAACLKRESISGVLLQLSVRFGENLAGIGEYEEMVVVLAETYTVVITTGFHTVVGIVAFGELAVGVRTVFVVADAGLGAECLLGFCLEFRTTQVPALEVEECIGILESKFAAALMIDVLHRGRVVEFGES